MTESKVKAHIDDLRNSITISSHKISLAESEIAAMKKAIEELQSKKDNTAKLSESHLKFSSQFNTSMSGISERLTTSEALYSDKIAVQSEKISQLSDKLSERFDRVEKKVDDIQKQIDF